MVRGSEPMRGGRKRVMEAEVRDHHEWQISQGSSGWLPWLVKRSDAEGFERSGWRWHDTDPMGCVPRQPRRAAAGRGEGVRLGCRRSYRLNEFSRLLVRRFIRSPYVCVYAQNQTAYARTSISAVFASLRLVWCQEGLWLGLRVYVWVNWVWNMLLCIPITTFKKTILIVVLCYSLVYSHIDITLSYCSVCLCLHFSLHQKQYRQRLKQHHKKYFKYHIKNRLVVPSLFCLFVKSSCSMRSEVLGYSRFAWTGQKNVNAL